MCEFSFVIPVYNAEKHLRRCLDAILAQSFKSYEVILVDDGSVDGSLDICHEYATTDPYSWHVIHQENAGPSAARNMGLKYAAGKYICFVDSDDYIDSYYLSRLYETIGANNPDVVFFGYWKETGNRTQEYIPYKNTQNKIELCFKLAEASAFGYPWVKCFSAKVISNIRFDEKLNLFEDEVFTCNVLKRCDRITILSEPLYHYVIDNTTALTVKTHQDYCIKLNAAFMAWKDMCVDSPDYDQLLQKKANSYTAKSIFYGLEKPVDAIAYFRSMRNTEYFRERTMRSRFEAYVEDENKLMIILNRKLYRIKQYLYNWAKRK